MDETNFYDFDVLAFSRQAFLFRRQNHPVKWPERSFVRCGLPFVRNVAGYLKPTTAFVQRFGHLARKNVLRMELNEVCELATKGELMPPGPVKDIEAPGYVIIKTASQILGVALILDENRLLNRFPKAMTQALSRLSGQ